MACSPWSCGRTPNGGGVARRGEGRGEGQEKIGLTDHFASQCRASPSREEAVLIASLVHLHAVSIKLGLNEKPALLHQLWDLVHVGTLCQHGSVHGVVMGVRDEEHARELRGRHGAYLKGMKMAMAVSLRCVSGLCRSTQTFSSELQTANRSTASGWKTERTEFSLIPIFMSRMIIRISHF